MERFVVTKFENLINIIIPFFDKYKIEGTKSKDFEDWCNVAQIMLKGKHLTLEGVEEIRKIKLSINTKREYL